MSPAFALDIRMAQRRMFVEGLSLHVIQRGNNRSEMFGDTEDHDVFRYLLRQAAASCDVQIHGYVEMPTHFHLLATPIRPESLSRMMQRLGARYVPYFNQRHERTGGLWEGRYRASLIDSSEYWMTCLRYIELNPVRAGLVEAPDQYAWSSYHANALGVEDPVLTTHPLYSSLGSTVDECRLQWRSLCGQGLAPKDLAVIRRAIHCGWSLEEPEAAGTDTVAPFVPVT